MTTYTNTMPDTFTWRRVGMLYKYCSPFLNRQMLIYGLAILIFSILLILPLGEIGQFTIFTLVWTIVPYMAMLAPVIFARGGDSRIIDRMVPASPTEKYIFFMSYILVVIPAICYVLPTLAMWIYTKVPAFQTDLVHPLVNIRLKIPSAIRVTNILVFVATVLTCFYFVIHSRSNRLLKGIASVFVIQIIIGFIGAAYGFVMAFNKDLKDPAESSAGNPDMVMESLYTDMTWSSPYIIASTILLILYLALMLRGCYRAINTRNL